MLADDQPPSVTMTGIVRPFSGRRYQSPGICSGSVKPAKGVRHGARPGTVHRLNRRLGDAATSGHKFGGLRRRRKAGEPHSVNPGRGLSISRGCVRRGGRAGCAGTHHAEERIRFQESLRGGPEIGMYYADPSSLWPKRCQTKVSVPKRCTLRQATDTSAGHRAQHLGDGNRRRRIEQRGTLPRSGHSVIGSDALLPRVHHARTEQIVPPIL